MADFNIQINPAESISVQVSGPSEIPININGAFSAHAVTHAPDGSDPLPYYATTGDLAYVSGQIGSPEGVMLLTGDQNASGVKNFYSRVTVNGTGVLLSGEALMSSETGILTGQFYPLNSNPSGYVQGAVVRPSSTGNFVDKVSNQQISGEKSFNDFVIINGEPLGNTSVSNSIKWFDPLYEIETMAIAGGDSTGPNSITSQIGLDIFTPSLNLYSGNLNGLGYAIFASGVSGNNLVYLVGDQGISGLKNFFTRPTVNGTGVMLSGEASAVDTGVLTGVFYPLNSNPSGYVQGSVVRPSQTGEFVSTGNVNQGIAGIKNFSGQLLASTAVIGMGHTSGSAIFQTLLGGSGNNANGQYAAVLGGSLNSGAGIRTVVVGGLANIASGTYAMVLGGNANSGINQFATIVGGRTNYANFKSVVLGGESNHAGGTGVYILGGDKNTGHLSGSTIIGRDNFVSGNDSIAIGKSNVITANSAMVVSLNSGTSSSGDFTAVINFESGIFLEGPTYFNNRPTLNGTGFLLSGEVPPTGYLTGYVQKSETGSFLTGETDPVFLASVAAGVTAAQTGQWTTGYNESVTGVAVSGTSTKTLTLYQRNGNVLSATFSDQQGTGGSDYYIYSGAFDSGNGELTLYRTGDAGQVVVPLDGRYLTGVDLSAYVTGDVVRPSQTGQFYPNSNPSGFITGVDLSSYATISFATGISGYQSGQINSLQSATGNLNSRVTTIEGVTGGFVLSANTGNFVTTSQTGQFYPVTNPSGYITGVDLSSYATVSLVTGVSGYLDSQITTLEGVTGLFALNSNTGAFLTTGAGDVRYVNATGDTVNGNLEVTGNTSGQSLTLKNGGYLEFQTGTPAWKEGRMFYDVDSHALSYYNDESDMTLNIGQENVLRVSNGGTGVIPNGSVVYISGAQGNRPKAFLASAASGNNQWERTIGLATHDISTQGYITTFGLVNGLDTSAYTEGDHLYLSIVSGQYTTGIPQSPNHKVQIGTVLRSHSNQGSINVTINQGNHLWNLHDVKYAAYTNDQILRYNAPSGYWEARDLNTGVFALSADTGAFLTTGAADTRYVSSLASQTITGAKNFITRPTVNSSGVLLSGEIFTKLTKEIWIDAGAMYPKTVSGATLGTGAYDYWSFGPSTDSFAQFKLRLPGQWNSGQLKFQPDWTATTGSGTVSWTLAGRAFRDNDNLSGALGTSQSSTDTFLSSGVRHVGPASSGITLAGTVETGTLLLFEIGRNVAADTFSDNARLLGIQLQYTETLESQPAW